VSANGRRRWRKWAKSRRIKMNAHHRALYTGARMRKAQPVELAPLPAPAFRTWSLVGMTMGARKRAARAELIAAHQVQMVGEIRREIVQAVYALPYRIGERLRPCPNPFCSKEDGCALRQCHGSGVLPARGQR